MSATMGATMTSQKTGKSPCGCGCSGSKAAASSSCGCAQCATCQDQGYTRPLFFAGQLLTEDDLQQLTDYVVAKNRLHTRYLAGSGVACGLLVTCEPCGGGKVIVSPGYAIDCCGNDIVLSCPQTLDINKMARDLKMKLQGGYDCGDPCADTKTASTQSATTSASGTPTRVSSTTNLGMTTAPAPTHVRKYCLYIDYCEQPSEPVSPYATDAPCGPTTCQPTRVREGFRFELRCPPECEPEPPLCCAICNCIGDRTAFERTTTNSAFFRTYGQQVVYAAEKLRKTPTPPIENHKEFLARLEEETETLQEALGALTNPMIKDSAAEAESVLRPFIDAVFPLAKSVALLRLQPAETRREIRRDASLLEPAKALASAASEFRRLDSALIAKAIPTVLERAYVKSLFSVVQKLAPDSESGPVKNPKSSAALHDEDDLSIHLTLTPVSYMAFGAVVGQDIQSAVLDSATAIRDWLVDHLEHSPQTCCDLLQEICALTLPSSPLQGEVTAVNIRQTGVAALTLGKAVDEVMSSCVCNALNPPCPTCDDTGVLLACLTVEDCKVKNICNMERDFVLSPVNVRYWFPEIQRMGEAIEKLCCRCGCPTDDDPKPVRGGSPFAGAVLSGSLMQESRRPSPYEQAAFLLLAAGCPDHWKRRSNVTGSMDRLSQIMSNFSPTLAPPVTGLGPAAAATPTAKAVHEAVKAATSPLKKDLIAALSYLEDMRSEHKKLLDRIARLEKTKHKGQPEA